MGWCIATMQLSNKELKQMDFAFTCMVMKTFYLPRDKNVEDFVSWWRRRYRRARLLMNIYGVARNEFYL